MTKDNISLLVKKLAKFIISNPDVIKDEDLENILLKEAIKDISSSEEVVKPKKKKNSSSSEEEEKKFDWTITATFGEVSENRVGNEQIGIKADEGFNHKDLIKAKEWFESKGIVCELVCLNDGLTKGAEKNTGLKADKAYILIARNGVSAIVNPDELYEEERNLKYDKKAWMRGKVVNLKARYALCVAEKGHKANYDEKQGTVLTYDKVPLLKQVREELSNVVGKKGKKLTCELNAYYEADSHIGYHGDIERMLVVAVRLGVPMKLAFSWFYRYVAISDPIIITLNHGDMYINSEKAVGSDANRPSIITLRHAAGSNKYLTWKPKKKSTKKKGDSSSEEEEEKPKKKSTKKKGDSSSEEEKPKKKSTKKKGDSSSEEEKPKKKSTKKKGDSSSEEPVSIKLKKPDGKRKLGENLLEKAESIFNKKKTYARFWSYIASRLYIKNMIEKSRYTLDDMKTYNLESDLKEKEIVLDIVSTLTEFYSLYSKETVKDVDKIVEKYKTWYSVLLQRLYKKYIDEDFEVVEDQNSYPSIVII